MALLCQQLTWEVTETNWLEMSWCFAVICHGGLAVICHGDLAVTCYGGFVVTCHGSLGVTCHSCHMKLVSFVGIDSCDNWKALIGTHKKERATQDNTIIFRIQNVFGVDCVMADFEKGCCSWTVTKRWNIIRHSHLLSPVK